MTSLSSIVPPCPPRSFRCPFSPHHQRIGFRRLPSFFKSQLTFFSVKCLVCVLVNPMNALRVGSGISAPSIIYAWWYLAVLFFYPSSSASAALNTCTFPASCLHANMLLELFQQSCYYCVIVCLQPRTIFACLVHAFSIITSALLVQIRCRVTAFA